MNKSEIFFYHNAGFSYNPKIETAEQGKKRCAADLAIAEQWALENNYSFEWHQDSMTSQEFTNKKPFYNLWVCTMRDNFGDVQQVLSGIDFGADGDPWNNDYRRVIEATLAFEAMS